MDSRSEIDRNFFLPSYEVSRWWRWSVSCSPFGQVFFSFFFVFSSLFRFYRSRSVCSSLESSSCVSSCVVFVLLHVDVLLFLLSFFFLMTFFFGFRCSSFLCPLPLLSCFLPFPSSFCCSPLTSSFRSLVDPSLFLSLSPLCLLSRRSSLPLQCLSLSLSLSLSISLHFAFLFHLRPLLSVLVSFSLFFSFLFFPGVYSQRHGRHRASWHACRFTWSTSYHQNHPLHSHRGKEKKKKKKTEKKNKRERESVDQTGRFDSTSSQHTSLSLFLFISFHLSSPPFALSVFPVLTVSLRVSLCLFAFFSVVRSSSPYFFYLSTDMDILLGLLYLDSLLCQDMRRHFFDWENQ